jgi:hypothetical protein
MIAAALVWMGKATGLEWGYIRDEEREWSARYLQRFAP